MSSIINKLENNKIYHLIDIIFFNFIIILFLCEAILFLFSNFSSNPLFAMNPWSQAYINQVRPAPYTELGVGKANGHGYLDTEFDEKNTSTYRIVALGDSFSMSVPYKYVHYTLLENFLNNHSEDINYEVYNMGISGTDPNHYYLIYKESLKYQPDFVIVTLYVGNDFTMELGKSWNIFKRSSWYTYTFFKRLFILYNKFKYEQQYADTALYFLTTNTSLPLSPQDGSDLPSEQEILNITKERIGDVNLSRALSLYNYEAYRAVQKTWTKSEIKTHFYEIMDILREMNIETDGKLLLVIAPDIIQIDEEIQNLFFESLNGDLADLGEYKEDYDFEQIDKKILEYCIENNIKCLDLLPSLKEGRSTYYVNIGATDLHWNEWGNFIAAREEYNAVSSIFNNSSGTDLE